jgi:hypothetical protein
VVADGLQLLRKAATLPYLGTADAIRIRRRWAEEAAALGDWPEAAEALCDGVSLLFRLAGHRLSRSDHEYLLARSAGLATDAAAACQNNAQERNAVEALERGRGVLFAKSFPGEGWLDRLRVVDKDLAGRVEEMRHLLGALTYSNESA